MRFRSWLDKLTTNGMIHLAFVLSLSKDLHRHFINILRPSTTQERSVPERRVENAAGRHPALPSQTRP